MSEEVKGKKINIMGSATVEINYDGNILLSKETEDIVTSAKHIITDLINHALTEMSEKLYEHSIKLDIDANFDFDVECSEI